MVKKDATWYMVFLPFSRSQLRQDWLQPHLSIIGNHKNESMDTGLISILCQKHIIPSCSRKLGSYYGYFMTWLGEFWKVLLYNHPITAVQVTPETPCAKPATKGPQHQVTARRLTFMEGGFGDEKSVIFPLYFRAIPVYPAHPSRNNNMNLWPPHKSGKWSSWRWFQTGLHFST